MYRCEIQLFVSRPELPRAQTVGQEATEAPRAVVAAADFFSHLVDDFVVERVCVDEDEAGFLADQIADEIAGVAHAN